MENEEEKEIKKEDIIIDPKKSIESGTLPENKLSDELIQKLCNKGNKYKEILSIIDNSIEVDSSKKKEKKQPKPFFESQNPKYKIKFKNEKLNKIFNDCISYEPSKTFKLNSKNDKFKRDKFKNQKPSIDTIDPLKKIKMKEYFNTTLQKEYHHKKKPESIAINTWIGKEKLEQDNTAYFQNKRNEIKNLVTFTNNLEFKVLNQLRRESINSTSRNSYIDPLEYKINRSLRIKNPIYQSELTYLSERLLITDRKASNNNMNKQKRTVFKWY